MMYNPQLDSKDSVLRAKEAAGIQKEVIRIGASPMTPPQVFVTLWPKIQIHEKAPLHRWIEHLWSGALLMMFICCIEKQCS